jgi:hypothetical protein
MTTTTRCGRNKGKKCLTKVSHIILRDNLTEGTLITIFIL